ncbi:glycosyltransferase, partial [Pseudomonas aeruginosa]|nr:glycosyltransferase [Pseudomonas aeruginosa]
GNVVLEAQAAGLAVVAFDQAAAGQHIRHGHNGVLAAPGDKSGFVEVASWLLDDQERLRRVRLNARQHASRQGWDSIVEHFQNYLEDACASPLVQPARSKPERPPAEDGGALPRSRE